uniref:Obg-like ATPase 1 n=1 Tax=Candidatus Methanophaga sp. ANME-1 ERB7 TaxID=2759913 RepID=A0A7G9Z2G6_9EURY|nr:Obg-like ATPase 1 [Methanosarcinales archaeon ANME-1 ERB7]
MLIGIVGKPSVGKSTFFMAATSAVVERSARPFTTIKPNHAVGYVEVQCVDREFDKKCNPRTGFCQDGRRFVPVELLDVAGLVPGAHEGKGLGNKFLDDLRQADILIHVVDVSGSTNEVGESVGAGNYDPTNDVRFLEEEIDYWIQGILERNWAKLVREAKTQKNEDVIGQQFAGLGIKKEVVIKILRDMRLEEKALSDWSEDERMLLAKTMRRLGKPIIIAANKCDISTGYDNFLKLQKEFPEYLIVPCSSEAEITLKAAAKNGFVDYLPGDKSFTVKGELSEQQKKAMDILKQITERFEGTGVQKCLNAAVFDFLHYIAIFPGGVGKMEDSEGRVLADCFLMPPGSTALEFAFALHSDIGKGFIKAIDARSRKAVGKEHILKHRDVLEIVFKKK